MKPNGFVRLNSPVERGFHCSPRLCVFQGLPYRSGGDDPRVHQTAGALLVRRQDRRQAEAEGQAEEQAETTRRG